METQNLVKKVKQCDNEVDKWQRKKEKISNSIWKKSRSLIAGMIMAGVIAGLALYQGTLMQNMIYDSITDKIEYYSTEMRKKTFIDDKSEQSRLIGEERQWADESKEKIHNGLIKCEYLLLSFGSYVLILIFLFTVYACTSAEETKAEKGYKRAKENQIIWRYKLYRDEVISLYQQAYVIKCSLYTSPKKNGLKRMDGLIAEISEITMNDRNVIKDEIYQFGKVDVKDIEEYLKQYLNNA